LLEQVLAGGRPDLAPAHEDVLRLGRELEWVAAPDDDVGVSAGP
jgi:protein involved in temperature-dependent protein secretion